MENTRLLTIFLATLLVAASNAEEDTKIEWLVNYHAGKLPQAQGWTPVGPLADKARIVNGALQIKNDTAKENGHFRAKWNSVPNSEVVIEIRARVESYYARGGTRSMAGEPHLVGAPACLIVSDGRKQEGLVLGTGKISTYFGDRVSKMDTRRSFHTYRLVIRGNHMSIYVDGELKIKGREVFNRLAAASPEAYIQFGSNAREHKEDPRWGFSMGESYWESVKLGVRRIKEEPAPEQLRITLSEPWGLPSVPRDPTRPYGDISSTSTRPHVYNVGNGVLMMAVYQGPDQTWAPCGVMRSVDRGRTWEPVKDLQYRTFFPQSHVRLADNRILGLSRHILQYRNVGDTRQNIADPGVYIGFSYYYDPKAESYWMTENFFRGMPEDVENIRVERNIFRLENGDILAAWRGKTLDYKVQKSGLVRSTDGGRTWNLFTSAWQGKDVGRKGNETAFAMLSEAEMTAVARSGSASGPADGTLIQTWTDDGGKTWSEPVTLEEGSVQPDLVYMSNGVLACSYGRPGVNLMFSLDKGRTWEHHTVIGTKRGYCYPSMIEVSPGRLLYMHDSGGAQALYIDVERLK